MSRGINWMHRHRLRRGTVGLIAAALVAASTLAACGGGSSSNASKTLTVWQIGNMDGGFEFMRDVAKKFEAEHAGVKVNFVEKPFDNFFAVLKTAYISRNGPDVVQVWPGTYLSPIQKYLLDLNKYVPASVRKGLPGTQYYSKDGDTDKATYGLPPMDQYYNMWYNKELFAKAGITKPPTSFDEMATACKLLRAKGITPLADGSPSFVTPGSGATQDWSYLASALTPKEWDDVLDGKIAYDDPRLVDQVSRWAQMYDAGCTSKNVTTENGQELFSAGKVAMMNSYSGYFTDFSKALGDKLGAMLPPWSVGPQKTIVEMPGTAYSVSKDSHNTKLAAEFVEYTASEPAQQILADSGGMPILPSVKAQGAALQELQAMAQDGQYTPYPMFDNYMPSEVVAQITTTLPQAFIGRESAAKALEAFQKAYESIPEGERATDFHVGG
jgi:raffinose/stachyose/melibiose transport system substrate-binding protein